jgi:plasmid stability protein
VPTITVRNVSPKVVQSLEALAKRHNRSMEQGVRDPIRSMVRMTAAAAAVAVAVASVLATTEPVRAQGLPAHRNGVDGIKALFTASAEACTSQAYARGRAITLALRPDRADLKKALTDDVAPDFVEKLVAMYGQLPPTDEKIACVFTPGEGRTEIKPYAATTEQLRAYAEGTPAYQEFPGGARTLAQQFLRPGVTFYEVAVTRPGERDGMKYHLFFWNGSGWKMLGPAWRVLR